MQMRAQKDEGQRPKIQGHRKSRQNASRKPLDLGKKYQTHSRLNA